MQRGKKTFRAKNDQILYGSTRFLQNEQVKGPNLLKTSKIPAERAGQGAKPDRNKQNQIFRTGNGQILYQTSEIRRFCTEKGEILYGMGMRIGKALWQKHCGTAAGLTPKPAATAGSAAWSLMCSICASAVANLFVPRKQVCSIPHN